MKHKPRVINYSMISMYAPERLFLRLIKLLHDGKLVITCHDVIPFSSKVRIFDSEMKKRKRYFRWLIFYWFITIIPS